MPHLRQMAQPALWGALLLGLTAGFPLVGLLCCCACCTPGWSGGLLAAYLYYRASGTIGIGTGAAVGALAGAGGAALYGALFLAQGAGLLHTSFGQQWLAEARRQWPRYVRQMMERTPDLDPAMQRFPEPTLAACLLFACETGLLMVGVSALAGLFGGLLWRPREDEVAPAPPPSAPAAPPPPPPPALLPPTSPPPPPPPAPAPPEPPAR